MPLSKAYLFHIFTDKIFANNDNTFRRREHKYPGKGIANLSERNKIHNLATETARAPPSGPNRNYIFSNGTLKLS